MLRSGPAVEGGENWLFTGDLSQKSTPYHALFTIALYEMLGFRMGDKLIPKKNVIELPRLRFMRGERL